MRLTLQQNLTGFSLRAGQTSLITLKTKPADIHAENISPTSPTDVTIHDI